MELIDKDALVAEIKRRNKEAYGNEWGWAVKCETYSEILSLIDTIEVKEVDLDSERRKYLTEHFNVYEYGILQSKRSNLPLDTYDVIKLAKHFFELGLKAQKGEEI